MRPTRREHPIAIIGHLPRYALLLFLPLLRGVRYLRIPDGFPLWLRGTWLDLSVALLLLTLPVWAWWRRTYEITSQHLCLRRGIVWRRTTAIPMEQVTTLTVERPLWLRLVRGARMIADTDAGNHRLSDVRLIIPKKQALLLMSDPDVGATVRAAPWRLWLLSVLSSDSLSGVLLLTTVFRQSGILLGEGLQQTLLNNLEAAADAVTVIPRTAALLTLLLLVGWLIGAARHLMHHLPFSVCRQENTVTVRTGLFSYRYHSCDVSAIHYMDRRQTLMAYLTRLYTVFIGCTGYGKDKNTLAVLLPPCRRSLADEHTAVLLPHLLPCPVTVRPHRRAVGRYLRLPLLFIAGLPLIRWGILQRWPQWSELTTYLTVMALFPCLWLLALRWVDLRTAGIGYADERYTLCYSAGLTLHRVTVPRHKVAAVHIRCSPWQRRRGTCDVILYSYHEHRRPHRVREVKYEQLKRELPFFDTRT